MVGVLGRGIGTMSKENNTFYIVVEQELVDHGLCASQAEEVMKAVVSVCGHSMCNRWKHDIDSYPPSVLMGVWLIAKRKAVDWVDKNLPLHPARGMFVNDL